MQLGPSPSIHPFSSTYLGFDCEDSSFCKENVSLPRHYIKLLRGSRGISRPAGRHSLSSMHLMERLSRCLSNLILLLSMRRSSGSALRQQMVDQNFLEAVQKSFSMASPNSSHAWVFPSATTRTAFRLACWHLSAAKKASRLLLQLSQPPCQYLRMDSGIATTIGHDCLRWSAS